MTNVKPTLGVLKNVNPTNNLVVVFCNDYLQSNPNVDPEKMAPEAGLVQRCLIFTQDFAWILEENKRNLLYSFTTKSNSATAVPSHFPSHSYYAVYRRAQGEFDPE